MLLLSPLTGFAVDYTYVKVGVPSQTGSSIQAMDNRGRVATTSLIRSFLFADNFHASYVEITNVNVATSIPGMVAQGLNDLGEVVGRYRTNGAPANQTRGFIRRADGSFEPFDYPGVASTSISEINNHGGMVGETRSDLTAFGLIRGFVRTNGVSAEIHFPGAVLSRAYGINDAGDIVGQYQLEDSVSRPFLLRNGVYSQIVPTNAPGGLASAIAFSISDHGIVLGTYRDAANVSKTWVMRADGTFEYPVLPGTGRVINNAGQIAGSFTDTNNVNTATPYVATPMVKVDFLVHRIGLTNSTSDAANKINDQGQITGTVDGPDGVSRGYHFDTASGHEIQRAGYPGSDFTEWGGITSVGTIAGYYADPADPTFGTYRAFTRDSGGNYTAINWSGDPDFGFTVDIDEHGRVAGGGNNTGWVWNTNGTFTVFNVPGFQVNGAFGMNDHGIVVGAAWPGFFDTPNGLIYSLTNNTATIWNYPGAAQTTLYGINNRGDIVGEFKPNLTSANIPFVRWADGSTQILEFRGLLGVRVYDINDDRTVVGRYKDAANKNRSFYATRNAFADAKAYTLGHGDIRPVYTNGVLHLIYNLSVGAVVNGVEVGTFEERERGVDFAPTELRTVIPNIPADRPEDDAWNFLGTAAGQPVWLIPEVSEPDRPWLGFSTEGLPRTDWRDGILQLELVSFSGPPGAHFALFQNDGITNFVHFQTTDGVDTNDVYRTQGLTGPGFLAQTHAHANWSFTRPGSYHLGLRFSGQHVTDGRKEATAVFLIEVVRSAPALSLVRATDGSLTLSFPTEAGARYVLQRRDSLGASVWSEVELIPGSGQIIRRPITTSTTSAFYRVLVE